MTPIKVMVADDHRMVREGLVSILESLPGANVVAQASDGIEAVEMAREKRPDVLVVDIAMPRLNGLEVVRRVKEDNPEMGVLVLTMHEEEEYVVHLVKAGADGFLLKDSAGDELLAAVKSIHAGR
ncbi:MAG: response regulator transcription factor, partial [Xanthomonadales bacterium]|nr:response regulator transcription factor [Xanthomonadales bacterium]